MAYSVELDNFSFTPPLKTNGVLNNITLKINEGEYVALIGRNGEGKTSIIKAFSGELDEHTSGKVKVGLSEGSEEISKLGNIGVVHQFVQDDLIDSLSISTNIQIRQAQSNNSEIRKNSKFEDWDTKVNELILEHLNTDDFTPTVKTVVGKLSGGQKQLLNVLIALKLEHSYNKNCSLLLLDEHLTSLDVIIEKKVSQLIDKLTIQNNKRNTTIIMVTHDIEHALTTDRIFIIKEGAVYLNIDKTSINWNKNFIENNL